MNSNLLAVKNWSLERGKQLNAPIIIMLIRTQIFIQLAKAEFEPYASKLIKLRKRTFMFEQTLFEVISNTHNHQKQTT